MEHEDGGKDGVSRREALKRIGAAGLAAGVGGLTGELASRAHAAPPAPRRRPPGRNGPPNILFVMTDDHANAALSCYGGRWNRTPNLDRLAREGVLFRNAFVLNSLCCPSRATLLTGKYSHLHGVYENLFGDKEPFDGSQLTFPKLLREAGYRTAVVGKWHLKSDPTGFDYWNLLPFQGRYRDPRFLEMGEERTYPGHTTDVVTDLAVETLEERLPEDRPFCLLVHHKAPHRRWVPAPRHRELYEDLDPPVPPTFNDDYRNRSSAAAHADMRVEDMPDWEDAQPAGLSTVERKHWNWQRFIKEYLRTIAGVDESVGRLLDHLERSGRARDTVVVYTTDNGFFLGQHGWFDKRFMYEESIRIPLLVRWPTGAPAGLEVEETALNLDFAETFTELAGLSVPDQMQGRSLVPLIRGEDRGEEAGPWRDTMYYHYYEYPGPHRVRPHYGVRTLRYKLIRYYTIDEWELFDLEKDPWELNSVWSTPAYAETREEMLAELRRVRREYGDDTGEPMPA